jgi:hypothetical protein
MTTFRRLVLGEFIFQLAIASTFHPSFFETEQSFLYVHNLLEKLRVNGRREDGATINWRGSSAINLILDMYENPVFDWIFRLSYLRTQLPLSGQRLAAAMAILACLENWRPLSHSSLTGLPREMVVMAELYRIAALILAHKIVDPLLTPQHAAVQPYVRRGTQLLDAIPESKLKDTTLLIWPIFFLGIAATTIEERSSCQRPLQYLSTVCGIGCTRGILALLEHAWEPRPTSTSDNLGLDVLIRDDLLSQIIF